MSEETQETEEQGPMIKAFEGEEAARINVLDTRYAMANDHQWKISWNTWAEFIKSGALPRHVKTPEMGMALADAGRVHGWSPMQSVRLLCLIEGQVAMTVNGLWMLVLSHVRTEKSEGTKVRFVENTADRAAIEVIRPMTCGDEPFVFDFTRADAETAKLWGKSFNGKDSPWLLYPRDMLMARCKARVARNAFGDVVHGAYTDEEILSATFIEASNDVVNSILDRKRPTTLEQLVAPESAQAKSV